MRLPGFSSSPPKLPPPPPPPNRDDPALAIARRKLRESEKRRKGRASTVIAPSEDELGAVPVLRASARSGAQVLGGN